MMNLREAAFRTHQVGNQVPPLREFNAYALDLPVREAILREGGGAGEALLHKYGALVGGELNDLGFEANRFRPQLRSFDRNGQRVDEVEFHPAYHRLMTLAIEHGVHAHSWQHPVAGAHVVRAALSYLHHQAEAGTSCPLTMTHAAVPVLRQSKDLAASWLPRLLSDRYDGVSRPAEAKSGVTLGMGMTEKQGGSDVRSNTTFAHPAGGEVYELVGHKWFCSAPMCDGFLVLAQTKVGLSCFLLPRWRPDGGRNALRLMRLKDKLGNWANASSEVEFEGAYATRVGDEGRGIATIIEMVALTRLDCMLGSAAQMRRALVEAMHHVRHRRAFGKRLIEQPLMREVLADLALESEAATALAFRTARAVDQSSENPREEAFARIATALGKFWICKRAPAFVNEAQECLGGAGYVEESVLPRLYREAPLNSIWEGCGNVQCLDVLRAMQREPQALDALNVELGDCRGLHALFDAARQRAEALLDEPDQREGSARRVVVLLATLLQANLLLRHGDPRIADAFCRTRLGNEGGAVYGMLPSDAPIERLLERALVVIPAKAGTH